MKRLIFTLATVILAVLLGGLFMAGCGGGKSVPASGLRSEYKQLDDGALKALVKERGLFDSRRNRRGDGFPGELQSLRVHDQDVVIDRAAGLVWHQSGSPMPLDHDGAQKWIEDLNKKGHAGYYNWRLPTAEEAASLLRPQRTDRRYIDPVFSPVQHSIRTGDRYNDVRLWGVSFQVGSLFKVGVAEPDYVRPVTVYTGQKNTGKK